MRTSRSARASAGALNPAPSVPNNSAVRPLQECSCNGMASAAGVSATTRNPRARKVSSAPGHSLAIAIGTSSVAAIDVRIALR